MKTRVLRMWAVAPLIAALGGCGSGVSGTYVDKTTGNQWSFDDGTATVSNHGMSMGGYKYEVDGKKIKLSSPSGSGPSLELSIKDNDCLSGPGILGEACKS